MAAVAVLALGACGEAPATKKAQDGDNDFIALTHRSVLRCQVWVTEQISQSSDLTLRAGAVTHDQSELDIRGGLCKVRGVRNTYRADVSTGTDHCTDRLMRLPRQDEKPTVRIITAPKPGCDQAQTSPAKFDGATTSVFLVTRSPDSIRITYERQLKTAK